MYKRKFVTPSVVGTAVLLMSFSSWGMCASDGTSSKDDAAKPSATSSAAKPADSANEQITALKQQMALQQKQIEQLQKALEKQNALLEKLAAAPAATAQVAQPAPPAKPAAGVEQAAQPHPSSLGEVASTSPIIPAHRKAENASAGLGGDPLGVRGGEPDAKAMVEKKLSDLAYGNIKIGATFFGDFSHYTDAGFAPAFMDTPSAQLAPPGNSGLNAFEVNRAYINLFYTPSEHVTLRITPDIYRQSDASYTFRLKYAYVDFQKLFSNEHFKNDKVTLGQTTNPLVDWEEGLTGYRFVYLMPWNYVSLSSTYSGVKIHGPIEFNGKEYLDYDLGVFNTASFHAIETSDKKQVMARLSWYPFGTKADRTGFGVTVFNDYGYNTKLPSQISTALDRFALLGHYQTHDKGYEAIFEYDLGHNAASASNLFSGDAPTAGGTFDAFNSAASTVMSGVHTRQQGFAFHGHARIGGSKSPVSLFGMFQYFQPNTNFVPATIHLTDNPMDFERTVGGVEFRVTKHFDLAFGDENFHWVHPQTLTTGGDTNGVVVWTQYNY